MNLVDVHCHLNHKSYTDLDEVIKRAKKAGLKAIVVSGTNTESNKQVLELSKQDSILKVSLGLHPIDALGLFEGETGIPKQQGKIDLEKEFKFIEENKDKIVAVGEVGLDYHWDKDNHQEQQEIFRKVIRFCEKIQKPIIVHTWEAEEDCVNILEEEAKVPVILHCFGGRKALVSKAKELGYYFTIPPSIVKSSAFKSIAKKVPLTQLLTETDAPWQSPVRGERNEPANVKVAIKKIAEIKKVSEKEVAEKIWDNFEELFL